MLSFPSMVSGIDCIFVALCISFAPFFANTFLLNALEC